MKTVKKLLCLLLTVALLCSVLPTGAWAAAYANDAAALAAGCQCKGVDGTGNTVYGMLNTAFFEALAITYTTGKATIPVTVLDDLTIDTASLTAPLVTVPGTSSKNPKFSDFSLDLDGHTIRASGTWGMFYLTACGLTLKNGSIFFANTNTGASPRGIVTLGGSKKVSNTEGTSMYTPTVVLDHVNLRRQRGTATGPAVYSYILKPTIDIRYSTVISDVGSAMQFLKSAAPDGVTFVDPEFKPVVYTAYSTLATLATDVPVIQSVLDKSVVSTGTGVNLFVGDGTKLAYPTANTQKAVSSVISSFVNTAPCVTETSVKSLLLPGDEEATELEVFSAEGFTYTDEVDHFTIAGKGAFNGQVIIPEAYKDKPVTEIESLSGTITTLCIPASVNIIRENAFADATVETVHYSGSGDDWLKIAVASGNDALLNAEFICDGSLEIAGAEEISLLTADSENSVRLIGGRTYATNSGIDCDCSGEGIEFTAKMQGDLVLRYSASESTYFHLFADDNTVEKRFYLPAGSSLCRIHLNFAFGTHTIRIFRDTGINYSNPGTVYLTGLSMLCTKSTVEPTEEKELYIEFLGDSITAGHGTLSKDRTDYSDATHSAAKSYSYVAADLLDADYCLNARGGIGIIRPKGTLYGTEATDEGNVTSDLLYKYINPYRSLDLFTPTRTPDVIVVALGSNDASEDETWYNAAKSLVQQLRTYHGSNVPIVFFYNMMVDRHEEQFYQLAEELGGAEKNYYVVKAVRGNNGGASGGATSTSVAHPSAADSYVNGVLLADYLRLLLTDYKQDTISFANGENAVIRGQRTWSDDKGFYCDYPADGIEFSLDFGGDLTLNVINEAKVYLSVFIDGVAQERPVLMADDTSVTVASGVTPGMHTVRIIRDSEIRTTGEKLIFTGISANCKAVSMKAGEQKGLYIEFIGDSITAGVGSAGDNSTTPSLATNSAAGSYAYQTAQLLDADYALVAKGGIGVTTANNGATSPQLYLAKNVYRNAEEAFTFTRKPDVIVFAVGTNDKDEDESIYINAAKNFVSTIREKEGTEPKIIFIYNMMVPRHLESTPQIVADLGGAANNVFALQMIAGTNGVISTGNTNGHPSASDGAVNAKLLADYIGVLLTKEISIAQVPTKTVYLQDTDALDVSGGTITVTTKDDTTVTLPMTTDMITGFDNTVPGEQTLTVTYGSVTATFKVQVLLNMDKSTTYSITLDSGIVINTYVDPTKLGFTHCYANITAPNGTVSRLEPEDAEDLMYFPLCRVNAKQMTDVYKVQFVAYNEPSQLYYSDTEALSIARYVNKLLSGKIGNDVLSRLLISMVNYGTEAQKYWRYNTDDLANSAVTPSQQAFQLYKADSLGEYLQNIRTVAVDTDYLFRGTSTSLEDKLNLRFYFQLDIPAGFTCKVSYTDHNGKPHEETPALLQSSTSNNYYCSIPLVAADLNVPVTVTLEKKSVTLCEVTDSLGSYIARAQGKSESVSDITKAMLIYGLCSKDYFTPGAGKSELPAN